MESGHGPKRKQRPRLHLDVQLRNWGGRGWAEAEYEGRRVQVDRGIPGEHVFALVTRRRHGWQGTVEEVLETSPERVLAPCPYYHIHCGGCQWQHLSYRAQVEAKCVLVDAEMERAGSTARVGPVHPMVNPWRYRRTAALALGWEAGFRPRGRRGIVEVHDCLISHELIGKLADRLNALLLQGRLPQYRGKVWLDCTVVGSEREPAVQVLIQGLEGLTLEEHPELPAVAEAIYGLPDVASVAYRHRSGRPHTLAGPLMSEIEVGGKPVLLPAGSFFQTNLVMLERVIERMREALMARPVRRAADIYGGVGPFALTLAPLVDRMTLVELDSLAVDAARQTAASRELDNMTCISMHAERALPDIGPQDAIIVDPPRSGLGGRMVEAIIANGAPLVLYLSCSPPSLADDLVQLERGGYRAELLEIYDFYPHTYHVETLAILTR